MTRKAHRVAVLGAGIMGSSAALFLARAGASVTLIDAAPAPFCGASRWNEGKIHLGYLYSGDPSLATARLLLRGGLLFRTLTETLIGSSLDGHFTPADDYYLVHRDTAIEPAAVERYMHDVAGLVRAHPEAADYLVDVSRSAARILTPREIARIARPDDILVGFQVPERSVETNWLADRFRDALAGQKRIEFTMNTRVTGVRLAGESPEEGWFLDCAPRIDARFDAVINALWEGSPAVDVSVGLAPEASWSHRFRLSLFVTTHGPVEAPSAVLVTGPFGDIKNYDGRRFYLSWYEAGLMAEGNAVEPPPPPRLDPDARRRTTAAIVEGLGAYFPAVGEVIANAAATRLEGGWVFAIGDGSLADPTATLHRRDRFGVRRLGSYYSVNTGKYSTAPWLARRLAEELLASLR